MEGEGLVGGVPCGCGLETSHVGAVSEFSLGVAADNLEILGFLEEDFLLLRRALVLEGDLWEMVSRCLFSSSRKTYQKHAIMQSIWRALTQQLVRRVEVILIPSKLDCQLPQSLRSRQGRLEAVDATREVVLRLVEHRLILQDLQNTLLSVKLFLGV